MKNNRLEKIIEGLKHCANSIDVDCKNCPYKALIPQCTSTLFNETIELLKEQDTQIGKIRLILNTHYGKQATEELK